MNAKTRLLTAVSNGTVSIPGFSRNLRVASFHREFQIFHMTEVPLRHLFLKNLKKSASGVEALFSTYLDLGDSPSGQRARVQFNKSIMEPFLNSHYIPNDSLSTCQMPLVVPSNENTGKVIADAATETSNAVPVHPRRDANSNVGCRGSFEDQVWRAKKRYNAMRRWKRFREESQTTDPKETFVLRLMSFNILAQNLLENYSHLYKHHDKRVLPWEFRRVLLLEEIFASQANVICLQEMQFDHLNEFVKPFQQLGFNYLYKKRTNEKTDGLLMLYRSDIFDLVDFAKVEFFQSGIELLSRDNVALIARLRLRDSPCTQFVVATTHLLYNPRRNDVRLGQAQILMAELERMAFIENTTLGPRYHPIVITGDFNLEPHTGVYNFITEGSFEYMGKARNLEPAEYRRLSNSLLPPRLHVTDTCHHFHVLAKRLRGEGEARVMLQNSEKQVPLPENPDTTERNKYKKEEVNGNTTNYQKVEIIEGHFAKFSSGLLSHPFNLQSVYSHLNHYGEREATTQQGRWITVDYIFFSDLELLEKYTLPSQEQCMTLPKIPNLAVGSDHLSLGASFKMQKKSR